jgi:nitrogen regulatory protein P-II 2
VAKAVCFSYSRKTEVYRGAEYDGKLLPQVKVEVVAGAEADDRVVEAVAQAARTGKIGAGKVWVSDLSSVLRIRTGETNGAAIEG